MTERVPAFDECFFCSAELPRLDPAELPAQERLAFDPGLGRLWRVCPQCARWNPVPLEDRWEVLESCERRSRDDGELLLAGDHLALFRVERGQLIRVGDPPRVDFADWRYSERLDEFPLRRPGWIERLLQLPERPIGGYFEAERQGAYNMAVQGVNPWIGRPFIEHGSLLTALFAEVPLAESCPSCHGPLLVDPPAFGDTRLLLEAQAPVLVAACGLCAAESPVPLEQARPALRAALGIVERADRGMGLVRTAVRPVERTGGPAPFIRQLARRSLDIGSMAPRDRLALWICLDEQAEAEALEAEWRRAEELSSIFDRDLTNVPGFEEFRARVRGEELPQ
jgi:hypothetical protein